MEPRCTCGAVLPEDARFCHKCGKPQYEEDIARLAAEESAPPAPSVIAAAEPAPVLRIRLGDLRAIGITMAVAAVACGAICVAAMISPMLMPLVVCAAGFVAARLYVRRGAAKLSPFGGATLGVMTGFWFFLVIVVGTLAWIFYARSPEGLAILRASLANMPNSAELLKRLNDPGYLQEAVLSNLVIEFFFTTMTAALGGLLAARLQRGGDVARRSS